MTQVLRCAAFGRHLYRRRRLSSFSSHLSDCPRSTLPHRFSVAWEWHSPRENIRGTTQRKRYTLIIDREWQDARGAPMVKGPRKSYQSRPGESNPPDPKQWRVTARKACTLERVTEHITVRTISLPFSVR